VSTREEGTQPGVAITTAAEQAGSTELEAIRQKGQVQVRKTQALREMYTMLEGCEWGSGTSVVKGSAFSPATRAAFAKFCVVTRANPQIHIDLLGGKPYLNGQYYRDKISPDPYFIDDQLVNLSPRLSQQLRQQAEQAIEEARKLGLPAPTEEVQELLAQARMIERGRAEWGAPEWATDVYECRIRRYTENAPLEAIRKGEVRDVEQFIRVVRECNWAGGRGIVTKRKRDGGSYETEGDPIGDAEPAKTARTRTFRRCARNAFSAWFDQFDEDINRAEEILEAEWEVVREDRAAARAALPAATGPQGVVTGAGEPQATSAAATKPLPVEEVVTQASKSEGAAATASRRAEAAREAALRQQLLGAVGALGFESIDEYAAAKELPSTTVQDLQVLLGRARVDAGEADPQGRLV
jgi:hypothetical protein